MSDLSCGARDEPYRVLAGAWAVALFIVALGVLAPATAAAQIIRPAPSSPRPDSQQPSTPPEPTVDDRLGKIGLNFGVGPLGVVNANSLSRKIAETGAGVSGRFGFELPFGLIPEATVDFAHYLVKGDNAAATANGIALQGGVRYIYRLGVVNPWGSVGGGVLLNSSTAPPSPLSETSPAFSGGGGLDFRIHTHAYVDLGVRYLGFLASQGLSSAVLINAGVTLYF